MRKEKKIKITLLLCFISAFLIFNLHQKPAQGVLEGSINGGGGTECSNRGEYCFPRYGDYCCSGLTCNSNSKKCYDSSLSLGRGQTCYHYSECSSGFSCVNNVCCNPNLSLGGGEVCYCNGECASGQCSGGRCTIPQCGDFDNCYCCGPAIDPQCTGGCPREGFSKDSTKQCPSTGARPNYCCCGNCAIAGKPCTTYPCCSEYVCIDNVCKTERNRGERCWDLDVCRAGLSCVNNVCCNPNLSLGGGEVCYCNGECASGQCSGGRCFEQVGRGEDCSNFWSECSSGLSCINGVCVDESLSLGGGEDCYSNEECSSGICSGGKCAFVINIEPSSQTTSTLEEIINNIIDFLFYASVGIVPLMVIVGGFFLVTAGGDQNQITKGKKLIVWAMIGFLIILLSKGIIVLIDKLFD